MQKIRKWLKSKDRLSQTRFHLQLDVGGHVYLKNTQILKQHMYVNIHIKIYYKHFNQYIWLIDWYEKFSCAATKPKSQSIYISDIINYQSLVVLMKLGRIWLIDWLLIEQENLWRGFVQYKRNYTCLQIKKV